MEKKKEYKRVAVIDSSDSEPELEQEPEQESETESESEQEPTVKKYVTNSSIQEFASGPEGPRRPLQ